MNASRPTLAGAQDSLPSPTAAHPDSTAAAAPEAGTLARPGVELAPLSLVEGTIDWLDVLPETAVKVTGGLLAGEPLHFTELRSGVYRTLAGIPVDVGDSLPVSLFLRQGDRTDTIVRFVRITRAGYPREQIAVAPAFVRPDSAAALRIQRELARSREVSRKAQETPRLWRGAFRLPRTSRITSGFGSARVYNGEVKSRHLGTDFAGAVGAPVRAAGRGVVAMVGDFYLAGRAVYLNHGGGLVTAYFHLSRVDVHEGQVVARGQRIGAVGNTGRVTGPHLHWVARYGAVSADPMSLLRLVSLKRKERKE
ncbi:MAG TPA: M23 family metallopeptidase [Gemmatimonadales bacterium]